MQNRPHIIGGSILIGIGALFLASDLLNINLWRFFFPAVLILIGASLIFRDRSRNPEIPRRDTFIGDVNLVVHGHPANEEMWMGVGDVALDLSNASFPVGLTTYRFSGFVGDIDVTVPAGVGVKVKSSSMVSDIKLGDQAEEAVFSSAELTTPNYGSADRKLELLTSQFVSDVNVKLLNGV
jgi:predicted membrane protein